MCHKRTTTDFDIFWNCFLFVILGGCFGAIFLWAVVSSDPAAACKFFTKDVVSTLISTFVAAMTASGILLVVEWWRNQKQLLSEFNASKAILFGHIKNLLALKEKIEPQLTQLKNNAQKATAALQRQNIAHQTQITIEHGDYLMHLNVPDMDFLLPLDKISRHAGRNPKALMLAVQSKNMLSMVLSMMRYKNDLITEIKHILNEYDRNMMFLGLPLSNGIEDTRFFDAHKGLLDNIDGALFCMNETVKCLNQLAVEILFREKSQRVAEFDFLTDEDKTKIPDK